MKKIIYTLSIVLGLVLSANAQIESLSGPRLGMVYITSSPGTAFLNGNFSQKRCVFVGRRRRPVIFFRRRFPRSLNLIPRR